MEYYDLVSGSCGTDEGMAHRLGFKKIFKAGTDIRLTNLDEPKSRGADSGIIMSSDKARLLACAKGDVRAVIISDSRIDKKLIAQMSENDIALCIPVSAITSGYGLARSKTTYMMGNLFTYAKKSKIDIAFVTLAGSRMQMASAMQLIELAMLVGADEAYARDSISRVNKGLME
jgi:RNase P/RNase MRP subunit p30